MPLWSGKKFICIREGTLKKLSLPHDEGHAFSGLPSHLPRDDHHLGVPHQQRPLKSISNTTSKKHNNIAL
jgi:hypothetical protein